MDLAAYMQIGDLEGVMKANGIFVPRLRGLRLMKDEAPLSKNEIEKLANENWFWECEKLCCSGFKLNSNFMTLSEKTRRIIEHYLYLDDGEVTGVKWHVLHGKKRKLFKFARKQVLKKVLNQYTIFNKYCGREDVLYIHARIGGGNWSYFGGNELTKQPWFIEKVDDAFDCTYCDIYATLGKEGE